MTTTVLVPLDGSDKDERVLPAAAALAELADGHFHLIHVIGIPVESLSERAITFGALDAAGELRREMEQRVKGIAERLMTDSGRHVTTELAEGCDVARVLVDRAGELPADLLVMATRAPGTLVRTLRGSVADRVMRESSQPVVLVPPHAADRSGRPLRFSRVLVPLDGSDLALAAIDHLSALSRASELEYILLEVVTPGLTPERTADTPALQLDRSSPAFAQARVEAERRLNRVADRLRAHGVSDIRIRVAESPEPAAAIERAVRTEKADFIAMSTRGASGLKRFVLGSVTQKLLRVSDVPVLLVASRDR